VANIPRQASWPVIEVGSDGGVMRGCGDPFWETVEQGGLHRLQLPSGCNCSCRNHDEKLTGIQEARGNAVGQVQVTPQNAGSWGKNLLSLMLCGSLRRK
jgi:hypothetical protein